MIERCWSNSIKKINDENWENEEKIELYNKNLYEIISEFIKSDFDFDQVIFLFPVSIEEFLKWFFRFLTYVKMRLKNFVKGIPNCTNHQYKNQLRIILL